MVEPLAISGVYLYQPKLIRDERGLFVETFRESTWAQLAPAVRFVQENHSLSERPGTLRGLHMQVSPFAQAKLVRVTRGSILDLAVDARPDSPTCGRSISVLLSSENWRQLFIPEGFLHGYLTLEPGTEVQYKVSAYYDKSSEMGVRFDDPDLAIDWQMTTPPILSPKDEDLGSFQQLLTCLKTHSLSNSSPS